jgi:ornithine cyclodeaminase/alanine dehydrogenase-like protein (mu-crystallin family)
VHAERLGAKATAMGLDVELAESAAAAARDAAIVVTSTPSHAPVLGPPDVAAGCFVAAVGADNPDKLEIAPELLALTRVVPDVLAQAVQMGDLRHALAAGVMTVEQVHGELADVVTGRVPGRRSDEEIFVFDSTGTAASDLAAAELVYATLRDCADVPRLHFGA